MPRGSYKRKLFIFIVFLLILSFLPPSEEIFGWGGGSDAKSKEADSAKKAMKKNVPEKKFKFHKIERIELDADDKSLDEDEEAASDNAGEELDDATKERQGGAAGEGYEDDNESQKDRDSTINSANNDDEEEEFQFKKARTAKKTTKKSKAQQEASSETSKEAGKSWFGSIFSNIFGSSENDKDDKTNDDDDDDDNVSQRHRSYEEDDEDEAASTAKSNGIIDWLMWLGEKTGRSKSGEKDSTEDADDATSGKPPKPIAMPKLAAKKASTAGHKQRHDSMGDGGEYSGEAMSQENFDSLLSTLPNFIVNPNDIREPECRKQMQIFQHQLRGHKLWTLQMLDSTGKIGNGLLRGNINAFGDFSMCTDIKTLVKVPASQPVRIRGKYCLAHIETQAAVPQLKVPIHMVHGRGLFNSHLGNPSHFIPRYGVANIGICIPNACSGNVVEQLVQSSLQAYNASGVEFHVEVNNDMDCYVKPNRKFLKTIQKNKKFSATLLYIFGLTMLTLSTLLSDHWAQIEPIVRPILKRAIEITKLGFGIIKEKYKKLREKPVEEDKEKTENAADGNENKDNEEEAEVVQEEAQEKEHEEEEEEPKATETETADAEGDAVGEGDAETNENEESTSENLSLNALLLEMYKSFSPKRTLSILLANDTYDVQFPFFHVLKIGATFMLYLCLKFLMLGHLPIINRDQLVRILDNPISILIRSPMIYADILLLLSGFLSAYQLWEEMEQKTYIQLLKRLASKMSRYLPTVYFLICFQTWVLPHLNSGPMWSNLIGQNSKLCDDQWWRNILSLQNAIDFEETCSPSTIQLALDVQLYVLGPLLVWLFYTDSDAGFFVYGALHAMSVAARFSRTNKEHLSMTLFHGINISKFYRTANILYSSPITRATSYLMGIGAGIYQKTHHGVLDISPEIIPIGWLLSIMGIVWCFWSPASSMHTDFIYTSVEAAKYAAWCPLIFGISLCWFIFMFPKSENSIIRFLLTSRPILVLSRLALPIQLVMYVVVLYNTAQVKESDKFHIINLINLQEIALILFGAIVVAFLIDVPSQNIRRLLIARIFIERPHQESEELEPASGAEDVSEEQSDKANAVTCDTPEPPDNVWGADPEEEEQRLFNRRRSSLLANGDAEKKAEEVEEEEEEEVEEEIEEIEEIEEEEEISEAEEVKKRPETPPPAAPARRRRV